MTHTVRAHTFEGPLDLLLELVERGQFEVTDLSISQITAEYLDRVKDLGTSDGEAMGEFLQLGSRLLYIKSLALLPSTDGNDQLAELAQLNTELAEYRRFQLAARELGRRGRHPSWQRGVPTRLPVEDLPLPQFSLGALTEALQRAIARAEPSLTTETIRDHISQQEIGHKLKLQLQKHNCSLDELLVGISDRIEIIVTFLALLELLRDGSVMAHQTSQFEPILLVARHV